MIAHAVLETRQACPSCRVSPSTQAGSWFNVSIYNHGIAFDEVSDPAEARRLETCAEEL